ncbi:MAG: hypothetical protein JW774_05505 [Candidatus Aureabacteria bacterium]|nr:hypothetical protein [Candidatus Auribacterota bacterium]
MKKSTIASIVLLALLILPGCQTLTKPGLTLVNNESLANYEKSLVLFSIDSSNSISNGHTPRVGQIVLEDKSTKQLYKFQPGQHKKGAGVVSPDGKSLNNQICLASMELEPGTYRIKQITGTSFAILTVGNFSFNFKYDFEVKSGQKVYLGRLKMMLRKKINKEEQSAGGVFPLIDQAASGYGSGTFEYSWTDNNAEDMALYKETYPITETITFEDISQNVTEGM